jgi:hypothetical protein
MLTYLINLTEKKPKHAPTRTQAIVNYIHTCVQCIPLSSQCVINIFKVAYIVDFEHRLRVTWRSLFRIGGGNNERLPETKLKGYFLCTKYSFFFKLIEITIYKKKQRL